MCVRFRNKVILVTGAARGIGLAISTRLLAEGARVYLSDADVGELDSAARCLHDGSNAIAIPLDVSKIESINNAIDVIRTREGRLDGLVNNAAILDATAFDSLDHAKFQTVLDVNLTGALNCTLEVADLLSRSGSGRILNIASIMGLYATPNSLPYSTAKAAMIHLTKCLAIDLAKRNITVNAIAPGFIETRMSLLPDGSHEFATEEFQSVFIKFGRLPLGRTGTPEDISGPAAFLLSDDAKYITGQTLVVDGGVTSTY